MDATHFAQATTLVARLLIKAQQHAINKGYRKEDITYVWNKTTWEDCIALYPMLKQPRAVLYFNVGRNTLAVSEPL